MCVCVCVCVCGGACMHVHLETSLQDLYALHKKGST